MFSKNPLAGFMGTVTNQNPGSFKSQIRVI